MHININKLHEQFSVSNDNTFPSTVKVQKHEILQNFFPDVTSSSQGKDSTNVSISYFISSQYSKFLLCLCFGRRLPWRVSWLIFHDLFFLDPTNFVCLYLDFTYIFSRILSQHRNHCGVCSVYVKLILAWFPLQLNQRGMWLNTYYCIPFSSVSLRKSFRRWLSVRRNEFCGDSVEGEIFSQWLS